MDGTKGLQHPGEVAAEDLPRAEVLRLYGEGASERTLAERYGVSRRGTHRSSLYYKHLPGWRNGRRKGLKIPGPSGREGSTPSPGI